MWVFFNLRTVAVYVLVNVIMFSKLRLNVFFRSPLFPKFVSTCSLFFAFRLLIRLYSPCLGKGSPTWAPRSVSSQSLRSDTRESSTPSTRRSRLLPLPKVLIFTVAGDQRSGIRCFLTPDLGWEKIRIRYPDNLAEPRNGFRAKKT